MKTGVMIYCFLNAETDKKSFEMKYVDGFTTWNEGAKPPPLKKLSILRDKDTIMGSFW